VDELLKELMGGSMFSKINMRSRCHHIKIASQDMFKTTFKTHNSRSKFLVMPFRLTNAHATFQTLMNNVFRSHFRKLVFFDDVLIYSQLVAQHLEHPKIVFELLRVYKLVVKKSKYVLKNNQV
jgi:hypothetical protein